MGAAKSLVESHNISRTMKEEEMILIKACVPHAARRFSVDLVCLNDEVAFHFNPRFDEFPSVVVCNTYTYMWWKEERTSPVPFHQGESFEMTITVKSNCYEVSVNGKPFLTYDHRLPYHTVKKLQFRGDITVAGVSYGSEKDPPPYKPPAKDNAAALQDPPPYQPPAKDNAAAAKVKNAVKDDCKKAGRRIHPAPMK